jgi:ribonuclease BN (tRNA processing enzyme)
MFLKFIGSGRALNTSLGNNSAFIKEGKSLLLIDCGSTVFSKIQALNLLDGIKNIYVLITHRHPDHIASLGDLLFYVHFIVKADITILTPDDANVVKLLKYMGVDRSLYNIIKLPEEYQLINDDFEIGIKNVRVSHVEDFECYGYILNYKKIRIYYSGDANDLPEEVHKDFLENRISYIYHDVCSFEYPDNPHMFIDKLCNLFGREDRSRVFCMHYDEEFDKLRAIQLGFNLVNNIEE